MAFEIGTNWSDFSRMTGPIQGVLLSYETFTAFALEAGFLGVLLFGRPKVTYPARQIAINAGEDGSVIVGKILEKEQYAYGFDSQTGEYGNLATKGIIDPTKVVRVAIQNAASVAALLITTEAMVAEVPKKTASGGMPAAWVVWISNSNRSVLKRERKVGQRCPAFLSR
jgi:hypothetical protein